MKYRTEVRCDRCGKKYITIKHIKVVPHCCKYCHSIRIRVFDYYETEVRK